MQLWVRGDIISDTDESSAGLPRPSSSRRPVTASGYRLPSASSKSEAALGPSP